MTQRMFLPLSDCLTWPAAQFQWPDTPSLDDIGLVDFDLHDSDGITIASATLWFDTELAFGLPGLDGFEIAVLADAGGTELSLSVTLGAAFEVRIEDIEATLRVKNGVLRPVSGSYTAGWTVSSDTLEITCTLGDLVVDSEGRVRLDAAPSISLPKVMIGETGVVVEATALSLYLSDQQTPPAGQASGFRGVALDGVTVYLPSALQLGDSALTAISATNLVIGTGGFSGTISGDWTSSSDNAGTLGGFSFAIQTLSITFAQNALTAGTITGSLTVPFFDHAIDVSVGLNTDGSFVIGVTGEGGALATIEKDGLGTLSIERLALLVADGEGAVTIGGSLQLTAGAPSLQWPEVGIDALTIDTSGRVTIGGGWIDLQKPLALNLYGFSLEITQLGFGNNDDGSRWIGCAGGIHLTEALPAGASVDGMRLTFGSDWSFQGVSLEGVGIELTIPDVLKLNGDVSLVTSGGVHYFSGSATLVLETVQLDVDASVIIGRDDANDCTFVYVFLGVDLPVGLPIGCTGAAVFGFSGLFGMNVAPEATNGDWYGWYKNKMDDAPPFNVTHADKWGPSAGGLAFGAGLTLGTMADQGYAVSAKGILIVLIPGPVVMLNAQANIIEVKPELDDTSEGTFDMLAVIDGRDGFMQLNIDAGWDVGKVLDIKAGAEAYFDFANASNWHVYLGQKDPADARIRAEAFSIFHADSYLMLSATGLDTGFGVTIGDSWSFGPVKATLKAWVEAEASITWRPPQEEGSLSLGGDFEVGVAGFDIGIATEALLEGKAPTLYYVHGDLSLKVNLPWPLDDLDAHVELEWKEEAEPDLFDPVDSISIEHPKVLETWTTDAAGALLLTTSNLLPSAADNAPTVPLDARPLLLFARPINIGSLVSVTNPADSSDLRDTLGQYQIRYDVTSLSLERAWKAHGSLAAWETAPGSLWGSWTATADGDGSPEYRKLQLYAMTPFEFARRSSRAYGDWFLDRNADWPCGSSASAATICVDWTAVPIGTSYASTFISGGLTFAVEGTAEVAAAQGKICGLTQALHAITKIAGDKTGGGTAIWIAFPEPIDVARLCVEADSAVTVQAYAGGALLDSFTVKAGTIGDVEVPVSGTEWIGISGTAFWLARVCYTTAASAEQAKWNRARHASIVSTLTEWSSSEAIFDPENRYRVAITTRATLYQDGAEIRHQDFGPSYAYFQTAGPPALVPSWEASAAGTGTTDTAPYPSGGGLIDLTPYVGEFVPENGAKTAYRAYDIGVELTESYVEQMYGGELADLSIRLLDANGQPVVDADGNEVTFSNEWGTSPTTAVTDTEYTYLSSLGPCVDTSGVDMPLRARFTASVAASGSGTTLAASTLYTAELMGTFVLFQDDESAWTSGWPAAWEQQGSAALIGLAEWDDYTIEVGACSAGGTVGVIARYTSAGDHYRLELVPGTGVRVVRKLAGTEKTLATISTQAVDGTGSVTYQVSLTCEGAAVSAEIDGTALWTANEWSAWTSDDASTTLRTGRGGLYKSGAGTCAGFVVRSAPAQPVLRWSFATSAYDGFAEHLASCAGTVWELDATMLASSTLASTWSTLAASADLTYETLAGALLGSTYRALPDIVELNQVIAGGARYALLVESPEPFEWPRISATLTRKDDASGASVTVAATLVPSDDGARAFVVRTDGDCLIQDGEYTWAFSYSLDPGDGSVALRRAGSSTAETGTLSFAL